MHMNIPPEARGKFYALRGLALVFGLLGALAFLLRFNSYWVELLGALAILVGMSLVRRSNAIVRRVRGEKTADWSPADESRRVGPVTWITAGASLAGCGVCYYAMRLDQLHGGHEVWPVYAFAVAAIVLALSTATAAAKLFR